MAGDGGSKSQNQKKKRQERDSCINNVKLNRRNRPVDNSTYIRRSKASLLRGSLENVSTDPWGDPLEGTLRRSRSLAITREDVFTSLEKDRDNIKPRRAQLIPRAKLIERAKEPRYAVVRDSSAEICVTPPDYSPPRHTEAVYASISNLASPKFAIGKRDDSLDSNYNNKSSINTTCRTSYEDLPGLSLPNYYPDPKYDTDNTDGASLADDLSSCGTNLSKKYSSCDNISTGKWTADTEIAYDDNIVLSTNRPLYDSIKENPYSKPKTLRGPTPYNEHQTYYRRSYSSDSSEEKIKEDETDNISLEHFETDKNLDEIKLNNENITKVIEIEEKEEKQEKEVKKKEKEEPLKTNVQVVTPIEDNEEYKTIVAVDPDLEETEEEKNKHSHNYLKEFLESQKGSKKPLQNFISKKLSNLSRKSTNLIDNRFYSLPDLAVTKSLRKCEKIDRKLRKCEKKCEGTENRFIVNIGKHFDITANTNIPVDFELKIAKVPRKSKSKKSKHKSEDQFLEAVKNLKQTLNFKFDENHNITKPEIVAVKTKMDECTKEYHEKLGTMRNYWGKMVNGNDHTDNSFFCEKAQEAPQKCKIVDVHTKVEDVKKKFEPGAKEPERPNKVQIAKQLFEKKTMEKVEKLSPFIKETCNYFENTKNCMNNNNNNQYESLNANTVEIISKEDGKHTPVGKSISIPYPEFDHVRYRVVKSDLFQKKIFANCEKESQFDGLMQYLQDYSFQELLRDNNIVIIEPIRSKIPHETPNRSNKAPKNVTPLLHKKNQDDDNSILKKHFFYHPIRVNKEMNDDELPNPDTVKQVRQLFEGGMTRCQSSQEFEEEKNEQKPLDPDKDRCSATDSNSNSSDYEEEEEDLYDSLVSHCCEQYVSEDILEKIRECGTTVTYYGGQVVRKQSGQPILTKAIMEEIRSNEQRGHDCSCRKNDQEKESYQGIKFKLMKSNSCNSRLQLVGTNDLKKSKEKYMKNKEKSLKEVKEIDNRQDKDEINESIKKNMDTSPKIIGEERKMTQWGDVSKEKTFNGINFNNKTSAKVTHDFHNYDSYKKPIKKIDDMEFEPYEVA